VARTLLLGSLATVLAVAVLLITSAFQLSVENGLLGVAAGLLLGLIRDRSPLGRYAAFLIGLVFGLIALVAGLVGWIGFVVAILILTVISALTGGRLPLWAMILGSGVLAAMYEPFLIATPWYVLTQYPTVLLLALATSAGGFIATVLVELVQRREVGADGTSPAHPAQPEYGANAPASQIGAAQ